MDDDKIPWTGGISNRQIFLEIAVWVAVSISLFLLLWWVLGFIPFLNPHWRGPIAAGVAGASVGPINWWWRRT
jgi:hypothetical protein